MIALRRAGLTLLALMASTAMTRAQEDPFFSAFGNSANFNDNQAFGVSNDGVVIVGRDGSALFDGEGQGLYIPGDGTLRTVGSAENDDILRKTSRDGRFSAGERDFDPDVREAYIYDRSTDTFTLVPGSSDEIGYSANTISADGNILGGQKQDTSNEDSLPYLFDSRTGAVTILPLLPSGDIGEVFDLSDDGSVAVGAASDIDGFDRAVRWTNRGQPEALESLSSADFDDIAQAVSPDGSVVVGASVDGVTDVQKAVRWEGTSLFTLGAPDGAASIAYDASTRGQEIVGSYDDENGAFLWDRVYGFRDLEDVLEDQYQLDLQGMSLEAATGITPDGTLIVGYGLQSDGERGSMRRAFMVDNLAPNRLVTGRESLDAGRNYHFGRLVGDGTLTVPDTTLLSFGNARSYEIAGPTSGATQFTGLIQGAGKVSWAGNANLPLSGQISTADFAIERGRVTLQARDRIGDSTAVDIADGATLQLNGFDETVGAVTGRGAITLGTATLTLAGTGTDATRTYDGVISGDGGLTVTGGVHEITQSQQYRGATRITGGRLILRGRLLGSLTLEAGSRIGGVGPIGSLDNVAGTVGPGFSIGTLVIAGNYRQGRDGTLEIELNPDGRSDLLKVEGRADLAGTLLLVPEAGTYRDGTTYTVVEAQSIAGDFGTVTISDPAGRLGSLSAVKTTGTDRVTVRLVGPVEVASTPTPSGNTTVATTERSATEVSRVVQEDAAAETQVQELRTTVQVTTRAIGNKLRQQFLQSGTGSFVPPSPPTPETPAGSGPPGAAPGSDGAAPGGGGGTEEERDQDAARAGSGVAAGDAATDGASGPSRWSAWADAAWTRMDSERISSPYDGRQRVALLGVDYLVTDTLVLGVTLGADDTELEFELDNGEQESSGGTLTAYAGWALADWATLDARIGWGYAHNEVERQPLPGRFAEGEFQSMRYSGGINGNLLMTEDRLQMVGSLGVSFAMEDFEDYVSSDGAVVDADPARLGTLTLAGEVSYAFDDVVPFLSVGFAWDAVTTDPGADRAVLSLGGGFATQLTDQLSAGAQLYADVGRDKESSVQVGANLRYSF